MNCIGDFYVEFNTGLSNYVELNRPVKNMCFAITVFKECVAKVPNLPAKILVSNMVSMATKFYDLLGCEDFEEQPEPFVGIQCYVCHDESNNTVCNENIETCNYNQQSCQTVVRVDTNKATELHITKRCFNPTANEATQKQWQTPGKFFSRYGCYTNLCNDGLLESSSGGGGSGGGGGAGGGGGGEVMGES